MSPEHQPGHPVERAQHFQTGPHRTGIGIVGVVDHPAVARAGLQLKTPGDRAEIRQARCNVLQRCAGRARRRRGRQRIDDVVRTAHLEHEGALAQRARQREAGWRTRRARSPDGVARGEVGVRMHAEGHDAPRRGHAAPVACIGVVGVDDGRALGLQAGHHLSLALRNPVEVAEAFEMFGAGIGDQAHGGAVPASSVRRHRRFDSRQSRPRRCGGRTPGASVSAVRRCDC